MLTQLLSKGSIRFASSQVQRTWKEVRIPGPYGEVAGKWWGPRDKRPILAVHGWQDNAGSFDRLIPLLPSHIGVLAIDAPGHGLSAQLPPGSFYHSIDEVIFLKRLVEYFGWSKVSLLAHSLGAICSFSYATLFPQTVDLLMCLDNLNFAFSNADKRIKRMVRTIDQFLRYDDMNNKKSAPPTYTFQKLEELMYLGTRKSIDLDYCKYILQRNVAPSTTDPNQYFFTRDQRLKVGTLATWSDDLIIEGAHRISCPVFFSLAKSSPFMGAKDWFERLINIIKEKNDTEYHLIDGTHHFHLNTPERVAPLINQFIEKYDQFDRSVDKNFDHLIIPNNEVF